MGQEKMALTTTGKYRIRYKYMSLYIAEFSFRYNNRENADIFGAAIAGC
jgi:hypothetical protein